MSAVNFNLKKVRIEKGVTQVDLSEKSGITQQQISRYETGSRTPTIEAAALIASALGVTLDELVTIREVKQKVASKLIALTKEKK
ncbi:MAG: helix-turn-helix transcriptional regulator [Acholeplasmataceae bacterium]|jgi:putative transcriptional regulator|nr:helix-turn-helix transcriptional regulator [Acholeplasmataceae bacterium]